MSPHGRLARFAQAESEKLLANTWPRAGESSWILSLIYFSRPEGHLLGTYGHFRVLVLHLFRLSGAMHQPRLFWKMTSPSNHCVMWIWDVHKRVLSFHKIPSHGSTVFSIVSSYCILKTILFWKAFPKSNPTDAWKTLSWESLVTNSAPPMTWYCLVACDTLL